MNKIELTNLVEVTYFTERDKNNIPKNLLTAMVSVPEESLPPMSEEEKKYGRLLDVYFKKASDILENEVGSVKIYPVRFMGQVTVVH